MLLLALLGLAPASFAMSQIPTLAGRDWLLDPAPYKAKVLTRAKTYTLTNGLISRTFSTDPAAATIGFQNEMTSAQLLRAVEPEAVITLDGKPYSLGGLTGQPDRAYLDPVWLIEMSADPNAFRCVQVTEGKTEARFACKSDRHRANLPWPPPGVSLTFTYEPPPTAPQNVRIQVHYELYDGIPLLSKWLTLYNAGDQPVTVTRFESERLALVEGQSAVGDLTDWHHPPLTVVSDYEFGGDNPENANKVVHWNPDPAYTSQVNYALTTPCLLECSPPLGPDTIVPPKTDFSTFRVFELVHDSTDRQRIALENCRMWRTLAPWCTENPIMMHLTSTDPDTVRTAIDQCANVGFEMLIISFGSGLNMEDDSPANVAKFKAFADYAHSKGIQVGGYSLLASRHIDDADDVINPKTGKPGGAIFGYSPCLASAWGLAYFKHIETFLTETGFDLLEHDGSYPGDVCASTTHPGHRGLDDSQWAQFQIIAKFYQWCRARAIYLNVPDWYFLEGSNKTGMGYREDDWSLPRARQIIIGRQNLYDGTWDNAPSMGWMFVPLVQYHGGGAAATLEPLSEHLDAYAAHLENNFGFGAQACYRGPRLYDSPKTEALVKKWVAWFKRHRTILESDVVHLRRADGRQIDGILHVNPQAEEKGLAVFYNPTDQDQKAEFDLPLYYAGLTDHAQISQDDGPFEPIRLSRTYAVPVTFTLAPHAMTWFVIRS